MGLLKNGIVEHLENLLIAKQKLEQSEKINFLEFLKGKTCMLIIEIRTLQPSPSHNLFPNNFNTFVEIRLEL